MITATGTRAEARKSLTGKWGKGALITLCYSIVEGAISLIQNIGQNSGNNTIQIILSILASIISVPLSYGLLNNRIFKLFKSLVSFIKCIG